jgi:hypothetical protein
MERRGGHRDIQEGDCTGFGDGCIQRLVGAEGKGTIMAQAADWAMVLFPVGTWRTWWGCSEAWISPSLGKQEKEREKQVDPG